MDSHSITLLVVLIILVFISAFCSATETAYSSVSRVRLKSMAEENNKGAKLAFKLSENYDELLSTILIGNNIVNISSATIATLLFVKWIGDNGPTVSTIVMTVIILIFGEITPKSLAKENPENFAIAVAPVINICNILFTPFNFLLLKLKGLIGRIFHVKASAGITESELLTIVDEAEQVGGIDSNESELLRNVIEFNDMQAIDIITPRVDVEAADVEASNEEVADIFKRTGYSRLPVYEENIDNIIGIIHEKDFHNYIAGTDNKITQIMKPAEFIPPTVKISELLKKFQKNKLHIAIVVDEFGGTEGIVTMENILEELVGEIWDEHDEIEAGIKQTAPNHYIVPENVDLDDFFKTFSINDNTEASTINGWVMEHMEKIPETGDCFIYDNLEIKILKTEGQKASELGVTVTPPVSPSTP